jgi:uncharacterized glyoxalase superfamily protein PhnB
MTDRTRAQEVPVPSIAPFLFSSAPERTFRFLTEALGFVPLETSNDGGRMHARLSRGDFYVMLSSLPDGAAMGTGLSSAVIVYVADVDALAEQVKQAGGTLDYGPVDQPYGQRECSVTDPDGRPWFLATPIADSVR